MYQVFISYRKSDELWARKLRRALARFNVPSHLCGKAIADARPKVHMSSPKSPASDELDEASQKALGESDCLFVIGSPMAAQSVLMNDVVSQFIEARPDAPIIALTTSGIANAVAAGQAADRESLPIALRLAVDQPDFTNVHLVDAGKDRAAWRQAVLEMRAAAFDIDTAKLSDYVSTRAVRRQLWSAVAAAGLLVVGGLGVMADRDASRTAALSAARDLAAEAQQAMDAGDAREALLALDIALPAEINETSRALIPQEALVALTRAALDVRLLADMPAPSVDVSMLRLLPTGVLAATEDNGRTHLVDLGTGETTTVYAPDYNAHTRISLDGETLWTAHFESERTDEDGERFMPLIFEEAELATGEVRLTTAVRSVPNYGGAAEISPDGSLFAVDLGAGSGENTIVGVFHREAQALAGVLTLPSDRARIWFVGSDHLLAAIDPPAADATNGPGLFLWRIGDQRPRTLHAAHSDAACQRGGQPGDVKDIQLHLSPDRGELALRMVMADDKACIRRWSLPDGAEKPSLQLDTEAAALSVLRTSGPYLVALGGDDMSYIGQEQPGVPMGQPVPLVGCGGGRHDILRGTGPQDVIFCTGPDGSALHFGPAGGLSWRGEMHEGGVIAFTFDPDGGRLITIGQDARLKIWDVSARARALSAAPGGADLMLATTGQVLAHNDGEARLLDRDGAAVGAPVVLDTDRTADVITLAGNKIGTFTASPSGGAGFVVHDANASSSAEAEVASFGNLQLPDVPDRSVSTAGRRFALVTRTGRAIWGNGLSGEVISEIDLGPDRVVEQAIAGERGYLLIAADRDQLGSDERVFHIYLGGDEAAAGVISQLVGEAVSAIISPSSTHALVRLEGHAPAETTIILLDLTTGAEVEITRVASRNVPFGFNNSASSLFVGPVGDGMNRRLIVADAVSGRSEQTLPLPAEAEGNIIWAGAADVFALAGAAPVIMDADDQMARCGEAVNEAEAIALSPDGQRAAIRSVSADGVKDLTVLDLETCTVLTRRFVDGTEGEPVFVTNDRLWIPHRGLVAVLSLNVDDVSIRQVLADRVRWLTAP